MTKEFESVKTVLNGEEVVDHKVLQTICLYQIAVSLDQISENLNRLSFKIDMIDQDLKNISRKLK